VISFSRFDASKSFPSFLLFFTPLFHSMSYELFWRAITNESTSVATLPAMDSPSSTTLPQAFVEAQTVAEKIEKQFGPLRVLQLPEAVRSASVAAHFRTLARFYFAGLVDERTNQILVPIQLLKAVHYGLLAKNLVVDHLDPFALTRSGIPSALYSVIAVVSE
jgi:hypothetical protein